MIQEEQSQLRNDAKRLFGGESTSAVKDMISILSECLFKIINVHGREIPKSKAEGECKIIVQMLFSKLLTLQKMMDGIEYKSRDNVKLNKLIDPTVVAVLCRIVYETIAMFNLVYVIPQTDEEKKILYNLWVIAGLKYRQRFSSIAKSPESRQKQSDEYSLIIKLTSEIENTAIYKSLTKDGQKIIQDKLKRKDYKIVINGDDVVSLSWEGVIPLMGMKEDIFGVMYTYFSLYSHPSNVAVFQYKDLFDKTKQDFIQMSNFNALSVIKLVSFFIADYIKLFPETMKIFESLHLIDQIMINFHSKFLRVDKSTINSAMDVLG